MLEFRYNDTISIDKNEIYIKSKKELYDFLDKAYLTNKITLKEEKEVIFFYNCLNSDEKKLFSINEYFDSIDIAYNYYNLINEIQNNKVTKEEILGNIVEWKKPYIEAIFNIDTKMKKNNLYTPSYLRYYNCDIYEKFKNKPIHIIDVMYISKYEMKLLEKISNKIIIHLSIDKKDYDENAFNLKNITFKKVNNINAYSFKDRSSFIMYLTQYLKDNLYRKNEISIIDLSDDKNKYNQINENMFDYKKEEKFKNSKTYTILKLLYNILISDKLIYPFYNAILNKDFIEIFEIGEKDILKIKKDLQFSKKYVDDEIFYYISNMDLDNIYEKIIKNFKNESATFVEALTEVQSIKEFDGFDIITKKEDNLKLLLKYLQDKNIKVKLKDTNYEISNVNKLENIDELIVLNVNENLIKNESNFILNLQDKKRLNILTSFDTKYATYFNYFKKIENAKKVNIFFIQNIDEDIDASSLFKEYMYKNGIEVRKINYTANNKINFLNYVYDIKKMQKDDVFLTKDDVVKVEDNYFSKIHINGYNFSEFMLSDIEIYFTKLLKENRVEKINIEEKTIGANVIGDIIHKIFQYAIENKQYNNLKSIKDKVINEYRMYILKEYINIYDKLIFTDVLKNIEEYLKKNKVNLIKSEISVENTYRNLEVNFRQDILIESEKGLDIVDIKTGKYTNNDINEKYKYQLMLYRLFNELQNKVVNETYLYYPIGNNFSKFNENITKEELDKRIDDILRLKNIKVDKKEVLNYDLKSILRAKDYKN